MWNIRKFDSMISNIYEFCSGTNNFHFVYYLGCLLGTHNNRSMILVQNQMMIHRYRNFEIAISILCSNEQISILLLYKLQLDPIHPQDLENKWERYC